MRLDYERELAVYLARIPKTRMTWDSERKLWKPVGAQGVIPSPFPNDEFFFVEMKELYRSLRCATAEDRNDLPYDNSDWIGYLRSYGIRESDERD